jgi:hypothetical protein
MEKKKIKLKTRFLFSVVLGILAFIIGFCISWSERSGDTQKKTRKTEQTIEKLCGDIGKIVWEGVYDKTGTIITQKFIKLSDIHEKDVNDKTDIKTTNTETMKQPVEITPEMAEKELKRKIVIRKLQERGEMPIGFGFDSVYDNNETGTKKIRLISESCSWEELEKITRSLVYDNEKIAKAKALVLCKSNPIPDYSLDDYLWNDRYEVSNHEWKIQTFGSRVLVGLGIAVLYSIGTAVGIFLILTIIPWLWYFLLGRIIELSRAIQGK